MITSHSTTKYRTLWRLSAVLALAETGILKVLPNGDDANRGIIGLSAADGDAILQHGIGGNRLPDAHPGTGTVFFLQRSQVPKVRRSHAWLHLRHSAYKGEDHRVRMAIAGDFDGNGLSGRQL
jgi:hypothetical protein